MRRDYLKGQLNESEVKSDPIEQFKQWFADAEKAGVAEPTAVTLATADKTGMPSARIVLLKEFDARGFVFYTSRTSKKGRELLDNPRASLVFFWQELERQVRIEGQVEEVSREQSAAYFHSRPVASQIGAWVSHQSEVVASREVLNEREITLREKYAGKEIPLPDFWGGFRVIPAVIEFWQGRSSRLHDRLRYQRVDSDWKIERLAP